MPPLPPPGTVTLELGLSGVPMVVAYRVSKIEEVLKYLIKAPSIVLTNLVLGENVIPELIQWDCTPEKLADALLPLLSDTPERRRQIEAFGRLDELMRIGDETPSERAARIVEEVLASRSRDSSLRGAPDVITGRAVTRCERRSGIPSRYGKGRPDAIMSRLRDIDRKRGLSAPFQFSMPASLSRAGRPSRSRARVAPT